MGWLLNSQRDMGKALAGHGYVQVAVPAFVLCPCMCLTGFPVAPASPWLSGYAEDSWGALAKPRDCAIPVLQTGKTWLYAVLCKAIASRLCAQERQI